MIKLFWYDDKDVVSVNCYQTVIDKTHIDITLHYIFPIHFEQSKLSQRIR